jgi:hypothetical protein
VSVVGKLVRRIAGDPVAATLAALVIVLVVVTALAAVASPGRGTAGDPAAPVASWSGVAPVTVAQAPDGGVLRVVEQGFSLGADLRDNRIAFGVVLENTSRDRIAFASGVTVRLVDAVGGAVKQRFGKETEVRHTVYAVFPGQRFGVAAEEWLDRRDVAGLTVTVDPPTWVPVDQSLQRNPNRPGVVRLGTLSTTDVVGAVVGRDLTISFTASSGYQEAIPVGVMAVLRDGAGRIVGGSVVTGSSDCPLVAPGQSKFQLRDRARGVPAGADLARTEVFLVPFGANLQYGCDG